MKIPNPFSTTGNKNSAINRPPLQIRAARLVAWVNLVLGNIFAACSTLVVATFLCSPLFDVDTLIACIVAFLIIFSTWSFLTSLISGCVAIVNDILIGIAAYWPQPFGVKNFFCEFEASCGGMTELRQYLLIPPTLPIANVFDYPDPATSRIDLNTSPRLKPSMTGFIRVTACLLCGYSSVIRNLAFNAFGYLEAPILVFIILYGLYMHTRPQR